MALSGSPAAPADARTQAAPPPPSPAPAAAPPPSRRGLRLFLVILVVGALLGAMTIGGLKLWQVYGTKDLTLAHKYYTIPLDSVVVNVGPGFLKVTLGLETESLELKNAFTDKDRGKELMLQMKNVQYERLGGLSKDDFDSAEKIQEIKNSLVSGVNEVLARLVPVRDAYVNKVIFGEFVWTAH
jgi:flagellar basal body-associated protein FliL